MKKDKKTDSQILTEKSIKEIESWGILTLMTRMRDVYLAKLDLHRSSIAGFQTQNYKDSPLENIDRIRGAFERKYNEEFSKIYRQLEDKVIIKTEV
jgi:hypothetical protein